MVIALAFLNTVDSFVKLAFQVRIVAQVLVIAGISGIITFGLLNLSRGESRITRTLFRPAVQAPNLAELTGAAITVAAGPYIFLRDIFLREAALARRAAPRIC